MPSGATITNSSDANRGGNTGTVAAGQSIEFGSRHRHRHDPHLHGQVTASRAARMNDHRR